jgi:hypothetical protein
VTIGQRISVDAKAYMELMHQLRSVRDQENAVSQSPGVSFRQGVIIARYPSTGLVDVQLGASDRASDPGDPVYDCPIASGVYPKLGATCFVALLGPSPVVLYTIGAPVGCARVWKNAAGSVASGALTPVTFGTVLHDTDAIWSASLPDRLTAPWPGRWLAECAVQWDFGSTAGWRELGLWWNDPSGTSAIRRRKQQQTHAAIELGQDLATEVVLNAGEWVEVRVIQNSGASLSLNTSSPQQDYSLAGMSWLGPSP